MFLPLRELNREYSNEEATVQCVILCFIDRSITLERIHLLL